MLQNTCEYFDSIVTSFGLLREKVLHLDITLPRIFRRDMKLWYKGVEVGWWVDSWGPFPLAIKKRDPKNCLVASDFGKIKNRTKTIIFHSRFVLFISIRELFEFLETLGIANTVEEVLFQCRDALYLITRTSILFPVNKGLVKNKRYTVQELRTMAYTPFASGNTFYL